MEKVMTKNELLNVFQFLKEDIAPKLEQYYQNEWYISKLKGAIRNKETYCPPFEYAPPYSYYEPGSKIDELKLYSYNGKTGYFCIIKFDDLVDVNSAIESQTYEIDQLNDEHECMILELNAEKIEKKLNKKWRKYQELKKYFDDLDKELLVN